MSQTCKHCGTPLAGYETFCPGCGREIPANAGAGFRPDAAEDTYTPTMSRQQSRSARQMQADEWFPDDAFDAPQPSARSRRPAPQRKPAQRAAARPAGAPSRRLASPQRSPDRRPVSAPKTASRRAAQPATLTGRQRLIFLGAMAVLALVLIIAGISLLSGGQESRVTYPFTAVLDQYFESVRTANANKFVATRPPEYIAYLTTDAGGAYENESDYRSQIAATLKTRLEDYQAQYGDIQSITYELHEIKRYNHRCEALSQVLTGWYDFSENAVTDAYIVSGAYAVQGANGRGDYEISELLLIQIDGSWYFSPDAGSYWRGE